MNSLLTQCFPFKRISAMFDKFYPWFSEKWVTWTLIGASEVQYIARLVALCDILVDHFILLFSPSPDLMSWWPLTRFYRFWHSLDPSRLLSVADRSLPHIDRFSLPISYSEPSDKNINVTSCQVTNFRFFEDLVFIVKLFIWLTRSQDWSVIYNPWWLFHPWFC